MSMVLEESEKEYEVGLLNSVFLKLEGCVLANKGMWRHLIDIEGGTSYAHTTHKWWR